MEKLKYEGQGHGYKFYIFKNVKYRILLKRIMYLLLTAKPEWIKNLNLKVNVKVTKSIFEM